MTLTERHLLADMQAAVGKTAKLTFNGESRTALPFPIDDVIQSRDLRREGRWVVISGDRSFDIFESIEKVELVELLYRNWGKINEVTCHFMRAALLGTRSPSALSKLQQMFPECFQETPPVSITWKQLKAKQVEINLAHSPGYPVSAEEEARWDLREALEFFNIPTVLDWKYSERHEFPPEEIWGQLVGKVVQQPAYLNYQGIRCIPALIPFLCGIPNSTHEYQGSRTTFESWDFEDISAFVLVPAEMIVFDQEKGE